ncbi:MAG TPA: helix-turn-helix domain-containing protein [Thermoanaerobaculia bacterium]|nr:helix-turn-helix domain-containing protein [Thermoanaerobaculia bacterium]
MTKNQYHPTEVSPPGDTLLEVLEERGLTQAELAERTGRPRKTVNEIIKGKAAITPETALQLERVLGIPASFWNAREVHYRESLAKRSEIERFENEIEWIEKFPIREMAKQRLIPTCPDKMGYLYALLKFFGLASPAQWQSVWKDTALSGFAFRRSKKSNEYALSAWLRCGQLAGERATCAEYNANAFLSVLHDIRRLTLLPPSQFQPVLEEVCGRCGVVVVFIRDLPGSGASGATFWTMGHSRPVLMLSLRYKTDDHLWFTFFHEAAHILLHGKKEVFIEGLDGEDRCEAEANQAAADFLIPPDRLTAFLSKPGHISHERINKFAAELGIAPGIVVGRLQHDNFLPISHCNALKRRLDWA